MSSLLDAANALAALGSVFGGSSSSRSNSIDEQKSGTDAKESLTQTNTSNTSFRQTTISNTSCSTLATEECMEKKCDGQNDNNKVVIKAKETEIEGGENKSDDNIGSDDDNACRQPANNIKTSQVEAISGDANKAKKESSPKKIKKKKKKKKEKVGDNSSKKEDDKHEYNDRNEQKLKQRIDVPATTNEKRRQQSDTANNEHREQHIKHQAITPNHQRSLLSRPNIETKIEQQLSSFVAARRFSNQHNLQQQLKRLSNGGGFISPGGVPTSLGMGSALRGSIPIPVISPVEITVEDFTKLEKAIQESVDTQTKLHEWDSKVMGLKKSHSQTMRDTINSRKKVLKIIKQEVRRKTRERNIANRKQVKELQKLNQSKQTLEHEETVSQQKPMLLPQTSLSLQGGIAAHSNEINAPPNRDYDYYINMYKKSLNISTPCGEPQNHDKQKSATSSKRIERNTQEVLDDNSASSNSSREGNDNGDYGSEEEEERQEIKKRKSLSLSKKKKKKLRKSMATDDVAHKSSEIIDKKEQDEEKQSQQEKQLKEQSKLLDQLKQEKESLITELIASKAQQIEDQYVHNNIDRLLLQQQQTKASILGATSTTTNNVAGTSDASGLKATSAADLSNLGRLAVAEAEAALLLGGSNSEAVSAAAAAANIKSKILAQTLLGSSTALAAAGGGLGGLMGGLLGAGGVGGLDGIAGAVGGLNSSRGTVIQQLLAGQSTPPSSILDKPY